jgi:hypothetical protein
MLTLDFQSQAPVDKRSLETPKGKNFYAGLLVAMNPVRAITSENSYLEQVRRTCQSQTCSK